MDLTGCFQAGYFTVLTFSELEGDKDLSSRQSGLKNLKSVKSFSSSVSAKLPPSSPPKSEDRHSQVLSSFGEEGCRIVPTKFPKQTTKTSQVSLHGPTGV